MKEFGKAALAVMLTALAVFVISGRAQAEQSAGPRFSLFTQAYESADTNEGGSYSKNETGVSAGYEWFTLSYTRSNYSWSHAKSVNFSDGTPWNKFNKLSLDASFDGMINDTVGWFAGGSVISGFEDEMWGSFTLAPRGGLRFSPDPDWKINLGVMGLISPVRPLVLPLVGVEWRNEQADGLSASVGFPATKVQYRFNEMLAARVAAQWQRELYRLANNSNVEGKGYAEESGYKGGAYLDITPLPSLKFTVGAEMLFDRQLRLYEKSGDEFYKTDVDRSLGAVLRASYSF